LKQEKTMTTFAIDTDNNITAFTAAAQVPEGQQHFATEKEFAKLSTDWPITRFVDVWNAFAGVVPFDSLKPVKKFTDRKTAVGRIWKAIQALTPAPAPQAARVAPKEAKAAKDATNKDATPTAREGSKKATVLELIRRADGASVKEIMAATDWQPHSVRGFISGSLGKKMGLNVESFKRADGERAYRTA
jgi:ribosomal protein L7/L12